MLSDEAPRTRPPNTVITQALSVKKKTNKKNLPLTSIGLTGVEGKGCRYSGCKMCPDRAVSIFKTLMGSRLACRSGSDGGAEWRNGLLMLAELLFRELLLSQATRISLFFRADAEGDVLMSQLSGNGTAMLSSDSLRKSKQNNKPKKKKKKKRRASLSGVEGKEEQKKRRIVKRLNNKVILVGKGARRGGWRERLCEVIADPRLRLAP